MSNTLTSKLPAIKRLKLYELALMKWKKHKGLEGQGGAWIPNKRKYAPAPQPTPAEFQLDSGMELTMAEKIKAIVLPEVKS